MEDHTERQTGGGTEREREREREVSVDFGTDQRTG